MKQACSVLDQTHPFDQSQRSGLDANEQGDLDGKVLITVVEVVVGGAVGGRDVIFRVVEITGYSCVGFADGIHIGTGVGEDIVNMEGMDDEDGSVV